MSESSTPILRCCSFCKEMSVEFVDINLKDFYLCKNCGAAYFKAATVVAFERKLLNMSRQGWKKANEVRVENWKDEFTAQKCLIHQKDLEACRVPDYGHEALKSSCCDLLHLNPESIKPILKTLCKMQPHFECKERKQSSNPFLKLFKIFTSKDTTSDFDQALESAQWEFQLKPFVTPKS